MNRSEILLVWRKETLDTLRDRRTILAMVVLPLLIYRETDVLRVFYVSHDGGLTWNGNPADPSMAIPEPGRYAFADVVNTGDSRSLKAGQKALERGAAMGNGINEARRLADLPGNICTPSYLAQEARKLARNHARLTTSILDEKKMRELGMGSLLSVSAGSEQPADAIVHLTPNRTQAFAFLGGAANNSEECYLASKLARAPGVVYLEHQARI